MTTLNISLPESMRQFIDDQVSGGGYSTASEYIRDLIRRAQKEAARVRLEAELLKGLEGEPIEFNEEYKQRKLTELRQRLEEQHAHRRQDDAA